MIKAAYSFTDGLSFCLLIKHLKSSAEVDLPRSMLDLSNDSDEEFLVITCHLQSR